MRFPITLAVLFLSVALLQLSSGGIAPLDALSGLAPGFTAKKVGLPGAAHFVGFFIGFWDAPRLMGILGHSRALAVFAASGTIAIVLHLMLIDPVARALMRVLTGLALAGCCTVVEVWVQAELTKENRGRAPAMSVRHAHRPGSEARSTCTTTDRTERAGARPGAALDVGRTG